MAFDLTQVMDQIVSSNYFEQYSLPFGIFILSVVILKIFKFVIVKRLESLAKKTKNDIDDLIIEIINNVNWPFYVLISLYISLKFVQIPQLLDTISYYTVLIIITYYVVKGAQTVIDYGAGKVITKRKKEGSNDESAIKLLKTILKIILWAIALLLILQNLGVDITTMVAGMGVGGIAIAFALQAVLGDVFASFSIYFDKPFEIGDFIVVGEDLGTVEKIGIKSTRIRTLKGEELVMSNKELTDARIHNYKKMEKRRIVFSIGVTYETPTKKMKKINTIIQDIFKGIKIADLDRVHFKDFGDFSLNYEIVYYLNTSNYTKYMDTQEKINLEIKKRFEDEGIDIAYPTQTLFVKK